MAGRARKDDRKEAAIAALVSTPSVPHAAKLCGVGERTIFRWLREPEFEKDYAKARKELLRHAIVSLQQGAAGAVAVLRVAMNDQSAHISTRIQAARMVLDFAFRGTEFEDFQARLAYVEHLLAQKDSGHDS